MISYRFALCASLLTAYGALQGAADDAGDHQIVFLGVEETPEPQHVAEEPSVAIAAGEVPSSYRGILVLTLQHDPSTNQTLVVPSLAYGNDKRVVIEVEEQLQYPPPGYTSGTEVSVLGVIGDNGAIKVQSWSDINIVAASIAGPLTTRLWKMKVLYLHLTSQCSPNSDVATVKTAVQAVQATWVKCSGNKFSFDNTSIWIVNVDIGCPTDCQGSLEAARNIALDAARARGLTPNAFPYHHYFWPKWISDNCWAGIAQIGCYGQAWYACRAEVAYPWTSHQSVIAHEMGHNIGCHHAGNAAGFCARTPQYTNALRPCSDNNEYGDETSNMGGAGWLNSMCFNLPQQHFLGWTNPTVWRDADIPLRTVKAIKLQSFTSTPNTGLRIAITNFRALYVDYIRRLGGRTALPTWAGEQVGIYSYGWDGGAFKPGYDDAAKTKLVAAMANGTMLTLGGGPTVPKIIIKRLTTGGGLTCLLICRYTNTTGECKFAGKTC